VLVPDSFAELMMVKDYQKDFRDCKCGIDIRDYTTNIYGAFWYCRGLLRAMEVYKGVANWAAKNLGEQIRVIIKRGCTEFEIQGTAGNSRFWIVGSGQELLESWLDDHLDFDPFMNIGQTEDIRDRVREKWMHWAHAHGDMSYLAETRGLPLYKSCKTYHEREQEETTMPRECPDCGCEIPDGMSECPDCGRMIDIEDDE
jgi:hypothetical protein